MSAAEPVDLKGLAAGRGTGVVWTLPESGDLNANLVRFDHGGGVGDHVNHEVDVLFVGVAGAGFVRVNGEDRPLPAETLVFVRKGAARSTVASSDGFAYLTVHRRRGPITLGT